MKTLGKHDPVDFWGWLMWIVGIFMQGPLSPLLIVAAIALGIMAINNTPREEEPQIVVPMADVIIQFPGHSPAEVEELVTRPMERLLWQVDGVEHVYSTSRTDMSMVTVRFFVGEDRERSIVRLRDQIESNIDKAPPGVSGWVVKPSQIDDVPIVTLSFFSSDRTPYELRRIVEECKAGFDSLHDLSGIELFGGYPREIIIETDLEDLNARNVSFSDIYSTLSSQDFQGYTGSIVNEGKSMSVRTGPALDSVEALSSTLLRSSEEQLIRVDDVATVKDGPVEPDYYHHIGFGPASSAYKDIDEKYRGQRFSAVTLAFSKKKGTNAIEVADNILARAEKLKENTIPDDITMLVSRNYGQTANEKVNDLLSSMLFAIVAVVTLIVLAMGWREGVVVGFSVPVSFALALFMNYLAGYTINRVTLFALILSLGMVVDDPITNVDNIQRHIRMGLEKARKATMTGVLEVIGPVIMSTLTIIVSFLPMLYITGMMGPYMRPMAINVPLTVAFSTVCALTFVPWLSYHLLRHLSPSSSCSANACESAAAVTPEWIRKTYSWALSPFLNRRNGWLLLGAVGLMLIGSGLLVVFRKVPLKMLPYDNKDELHLVIDMPEGTSLETTDRICQEIETVLAQVNEVRNYQTYTGVNSPIDFNGLVRHYGMRREANQAEIRVNLAGKLKRKQQSHDIALRLRDELTEIVESEGGMLSIVEIPPGPPVLSTLTVEVTGDPSMSYEEILEGANVLKQRLAEEDSHHIAQIDDMGEEPHPGMRIIVDREKASSSGISIAQVTQVVNMALSGTAPGALHVSSERNPLLVRTRLPYADRNNPERLKQLTLRSNSGKLVQLGEIARITTQLEPQPIFHKNMERVVFVTAECVGRPLGEIVFDMHKRLKENPLPAGIVTRWAGEGEWQITVDVFRDLGIAFGAALLAIYLLLILQTGSFSMPLMIMSAIPLTAIGIMPGFYLLNLFADRPVGGYPTPVYFTATAMIGMIALGGIVIRNSIVLIEFIQQALADGRPVRQALLESGAVRFRPIVLTALTTMIGAWPITLDPIFSGLAWSLIFGLLASTMFTLIVIPTVYYLFGPRDFGGNEEEELI